MEGAVFPAAPEPLSERFAAQLAKRLRDHDPHTTPALGWLEDRLKLQNVSIDDAVRHSHQRQGVSNVTVRNIITSMRLISDVDWADLFESISLVDARLRAASGFAAMDFPTRNLYRSAIEHLARGSKLSELEVVGRVLGAARAVAAGTDDASEARASAIPVSSDRQRATRVRGNYRLPSPVPAVDPPFQRPPRVGGYVGAILSVTAAALALALWVLADFGLGSFWLAGFAALAFLPATEIAAALVNRAAAWTFGATALPGLELIDGVRIAAHRRRGADDADQRSRSAGADRTAGDPPSVRRERRSDVHVASGRHRCGRGSSSARRRSADPRRRGDRPPEPPPRAGARRRKPFPASASTPPV